MRNFQQILIDADYQVRSYSGRGMYGRECLGVMIEQYSSLGNLFADLIETASSGSDSDELQTVADSIRDFKQDSLGRDTIVYFPNIPWNSDLESDDDFKERILNVMPAGHTYTAEDLGEASGQGIDDIGARYGIKRKCAEN